MSVIMALFKKTSFESVEKTSDFGLLKFTTVNMAGKCLQRASFRIENLFSKD